MRGAFGLVGGEAGLTGFEDVVGADQFDQAHALEAAQMADRSDDEGECDANLSEVLVKFRQGATCRKI